MPDPAWPSSPPEANYLRLVGSGAAGTATAVANSAAWQALMASHQAAFAASTLNTTATAVSFEGVGGTSSAATVTGLNAALQLLAGWVQEKPPIVASAVAAYETAVSAMIPAEVAAANRAEQAADVALNPLVLGALTPVIVALDTVYFGEFWPQNAASGAAYGATVAALAAALAVPPPMSPPGASVAAPGAAAAALAESAAQAAAGELVQESAGAARSAEATAPVPAAAAGQAGQVASMMGQPLQAALGGLQPLSGMFSAPYQALQSLAGLPASMASVTGMGLDAKGIHENRALAPILSGAPVSGGGPLAGLGAGAGSSPVAATTGASIGGQAATPGAGLTSYTRPPSAFGSEAGGRPSGLRTSLLATADPRASGVAGAAPMTPAPVQPAPNRSAADKEEVAYARIVGPSETAQTDRHS